MSFLRPKMEVNKDVPNPADLINRLNNQRGRRLAEGGRNSTFLGATIDGAQASTPRATLTGLDG
jgi:hypothetical protein